MYVVWTGLGLGRKGGRRFRTKERKKAVGLGNGRHWGPVGSLLRGLASWRSGIHSFIMADFSASVRCLTQVNIARQRKCSSLLQSNIEPTQAVAPADKENPGLSSACCGPTVHLVSLHFLDTPVCAVMRSWGQAQRARGDFSFGFLFPPGQ